MFNVFLIVPPSNSRKWDWQHVPIGNQSEKSVSHPVGLRTRLFQCLSVEFVQESSGTVRCRQRFKFQMSQGKASWRAASLHSSVKLTSIFLNQRIFEIQFIMRIDQFDKWCNRPISTPWWHDPKGPSSACDKSPDENDAKFKDPRIHPCHHWHLSINSYISIQWESSLNKSCVPFMVKLCLINASFKVFLQFENLNCIKKQHDKLVRLVLSLFAPRLRKKFPK